LEPQDGSSHELLDDWLGQNWQNQVEALIRHRWHTGLCVLQCSTIITCTNVRLIITAIEGDSPIVTSVVSSTSDLSFLNAVWTNLGRSKPLEGTVSTLRHRGGRWGRSSREDVSPTLRRRCVACGKLILDATNLNNPIQGSNIQTGFDSEGTSDREECGRIQIHVEIQTRRRRSRLGSKREIRIRVNIAQSNSK
jgi:hypothetical protein